MQVVWRVAAEAALTRPARAKREQRGGFELTKIKPFYEVDSWRRNRKPKQQSARLKFRREAAGRIWARGFEK